MAQKLLLKAIENGVVTSQGSRDDPDVLNVDFDRWLETKEGSS